MPSVVSPEPVRDFLVTVVWQSRGPSASELAAVRKVFPELAHQPPAELRERLTTDDGRWVFGFCGSWRIHDVRSRATELGLRIEAAELR